MYKTQSPSVHKSPLTFGMVMLLPAVSTSRNNTTENPFVGQGFFGSDRLPSDLSNADVRQRGDRAGVGVDRASPSQVLSLDKRTKANAHPKSPPEPHAIHPPVDVLGVMPRIDPNLKSTLG